VSRRRHTTGTYERYQRVPDAFDYLDPPEPSVQKPWPVEVVCEVCQRPINENRAQHYRTCNTVCELEAERRGLLDEIEAANWKNDTQGAIEGLVNYLRKYR
jgi:hypothetical protein